MNEDELTPQPIIDPRTYDNEWVRFVNQLSKNEGLSKIAIFAKESNFTLRAKRKIIAYTYAALGRNLSVTFVRDHADRNLLQCDKAVIDSVLKLGLTNFDVTPEFEMICAMISQQFDIMLLQATGGFERRQINTTERRINREDTLNQTQPNVGVIRRYLNPGEQQ